MFKALNSGLLFLLQALTLFAISGCVPAEFREHRTFVEQNIIGNASIGHSQLDFNDLTLHYHYRGEPVKAVVLWIHGTPGSWSEIGRLFVDADFLSEFKFVSIDRPGWGDSQFKNVAVDGNEKSTTQLRASALTLKEQSAYISKLIDSLKSAHPEVPLIVAGHSWGASLIPVLAADNRDQINGALLFAGGISPELTQPRWYHRWAKYWPVSKLIGSELRHSNKEMLALPISLADFSVRWSELDHLPIVVVQGGKDPLVDPKNADFAATKLKNHRSHHILKREDLGHLLHISETPLIIACIRAAVSGVLHQCS